MKDKIKNIAIDMFLWLFIISLLMIPIIVTGNIYLIIPQLFIIATVGNMYYEKALKRHNIETLPPIKTATDLLYSYKNRIKANIFFMVIIFLGFVGTAIVLYWLIQINYYKANMIFVLSAALIGSMLAFYGLCITNNEIKYDYDVLKFDINNPAHNLSQWSEIIKNNDNYKCQICGKTNNLEAHHLIPKSLDNKYKYYTCNGITLCQKCHQKAHKLLSRFERVCDIIPKDSEISPLMTKENSKRIINRKKFTMKHGDENRKMVKNIYEQGVTSSAGITRILKSKYNISLTPQRVSQIKKELNLNNQDNNQS